MMRWKRTRAEHLTYEATVPGIGTVGHITLSPEDRPDGYRWDWEARLDGQRIAGGRAATERAARQAIEENYP